jgi:hypothetical protein
VNAADDEIMQCTGLNEHAMTPPSEKQVAALREAIRRAGTSVRTQQIVLRIVAALLLASMLGSMPAIITDERAKAGLPPPSAELQWILAVASLALTGLATLLVARAARKADRRSRCELLARRLGVLSVAEQAEVLLPLRRDRAADTRGIAEGLIVGLRLPTEISPSAAPAGRGDELTPELRPTERKHP